MNEYRHHIQTKGSYQIVALTRDSEYQEDEIYAYAVMSSSGVKLRQELTLDGAQIWLDDWIIKELLASGTDSPDMMSPSRPAELSGLRAGRKRR
ncbi:hypothetical protein [Lysobacter sp. CA199]|uniref:hypothetical protein n=1 Tax=Lysobacter sp. CA199 TaxID=3455608 RepID=UPI003F8D4100